MIKVPDVWVLCDACRPGYRIKIVLKYEHIFNQDACLPFRLNRGVYNGPSKIGTPVYNQNIVYRSGR